MLDRADADPHVTCSTTPRRSTALRRPERLVPGPGDLAGVLLPVESAGEHPMPLCSMQAGPAGFAPLCAMIIDVDRIGRPSTCMIRSCRPRRRGSPEGMPAAETLGIEVRISSGTAPFHGRPVIEIAAVFQQLDIGIIDARCGWPLRAARAWSVLSKAATMLSPCQSWFDPLRQFPSCRSDCDGP